ncbi:hypothetical protein LSTR_LSTR011049 [Laodelphax striatellus]|uniref:Uncharacterized protein n=1 Tax=Laodelphax striatellus TaxID=195883 RepID=A0A482WH48_LAOST|nr:hypothetical protein LSTR_LSTR011049 [Laodelphax striatellus]
MTDSITNVTVKKKRKFTNDKNELLKMDKEELADLLIRMESHNQHLKNIIAKLDASPEDCETAPKRKFDFTKKHQRDGSTVSDSFNLNEGELQRTKCKLQFMGIQNTDSDDDEMGWTLPTIILCGTTRKELTDNIRNGNTNLSHATLCYLEKYKIKPGSANRENRFEALNHGPIVRDIPKPQPRRIRHHNNEHRHHHNHPQHQENHYPGSRILDITELKQQPKLL